MIFDSSIFYIFHLILFSEYYYNNRNWWMTRWFVKLGRNAFTQLKRNFIIFHDIFLYFRKLLWLKSQSVHLYYELRHHCQIVNVQTVVQTILHSSSIHFLVYTVVDVVQKMQTPANIKICNLRKSNKRNKKKQSFFY